VHAWQRILLGSLLIVAVGVAGIALNFALLGLTQDSNDPVGKLSPRAVFTDQPARTTTTPAIESTPTVTESLPTQGGDHAPGGSDDDSDD
jgi:hypothetical protein